MTAITVIGCGTSDAPGPGARGPAAPLVPGDATLVVGARRHLDAAGVPPAAERVVLGPLAPALDAIESHLAAAGAPAVGAWATDSPAVDAWATASPAAEAPAADTPATETLATVAPTADAPATDSSAAEAPPADFPAAEGPAADSPAAESTTTDAPATDIPTTHAPATDSPAADAPARAGARREAAAPAPGPAEPAGPGPGAAGNSGHLGRAGDGRAAGPRAAGPRAARVVVLASGDPGFFGIVRALAQRFGARALDVRPSSPSVAVAFARLGLAWDDAVVVSAHGRDPRTAVNVCRAHPKTAVLTGPGAGPAELGAALAGTGIERTLVVAAALGTAAETVRRLTPREAAARDWSRAGVNVVLCLDERRVLAPRRTVAGPPPAPAGWALPEAQFSHRDSMVTKYEVRALALSRLGPRTGELVWDVGAGSGSVAVECARFGAAAVAVERTADGVARIRANAAAHGVDVQVVHGAAPEALDALPEPDAVFVGGGGADLPAIVARCARRARRAVVVTLAAVDRVEGVRSALAAAGWRTDGVLLQSSRLSPLPGGVSRLAAANPVFVLWAARTPGTTREGGLL